MTVEFSSFGLSRIKCYSNEEKCMCLCDFVCISAEGWEVKILIMQMQPLGK